MNAPYLRHASPEWETNSVLNLMHTGLLKAHFQPIVELRQARVLAHEALIRSPEDCPWPNPDALFSAARAQGHTIHLELECLRQALSAWSDSPREGRLFINMSASSLIEALANDGIEWLTGTASAAGVALSSIVIELTEHEHVTHLQPIQEALAVLRRAGAALALDDFGDGRSSLRLWSELRPEYVKIDKYFVQSVHQKAHKLHTLRALQQLADTFGSELIAEGVEQPEELRVLRDVGIPFAQGFLLGRPQATVTATLNDTTLDVLRQREIAVLPLQRQVSNRGLTASSLLLPAASVLASATHDDVATLFKHHPDLHAVALVEEERPVGLISRKTIQDLYLKLYTRDLFGRRPCQQHANLQPLLVDIHTPIESLTQVLTSSDQRYLSEGFIITEGGRYRGLGTGEQLVRAVTEARIEAARHANPLTFLPGNIPITLHIDRLLNNGHDFVACYADLNQFKAYNDQYGYWRGDKMICLQAECLQAACDPQRDFLGHVGGDDFVLLMQSPDWRERLERAVERFNHEALLLFDDEARHAGGIYAEDRYGVTRFHTCTTLSIGVLLVSPGDFDHADEVASAAASAKREAKSRHLGLRVVESGQLAEQQKIEETSPRR